jgi:hypothetical protein
MIQHFIDIVIVAKRIEQGMRADRFTDLSDKKGFTRGKKDIEVNDVEGKGYKGKGYQNTYNYQTPTPTYSQNKFLSLFPLNQPNH